MLGGMDERIALRAREEHRLHVIRLSLEGHVTVRQAAEVLGLSRRQVLRLRDRVATQGRLGIQHAGCGRAAPNRLPEAVAARVVALAQDRYAGLNDSHLAEKLREVDGLAVSRATVQRLLRAHGLPSPRRRRPPRHHRRRTRRPQAGLRLLWDGSHHRWLGPEGPELCLVAALDDATGELLPGGHFRTEEDAAGYLHVLRTLVASCGLPGGIYMDRHGSLHRNDRHWTHEEELRGRQDPTQVGLALEALGIEAIYALTPQAKGRVERLWGTLQDRLVAELRLVGITTPEAATAFLNDVFRPAFNARFAVAPADAHPAWRPVPHTLDLDRLCSVRYAATVLNDHTVRLSGTILDLPPGPASRSYAKAHVEVRHLLDGSWRVYYHDRLVATQATDPALPGPPRALRRPRRPSASVALTGDI